MDAKDLVRLLDKYQAGTCTEEEKRIVEDWYDQYDQPENNKVLPSDTHYDEMYAQLVRKIEQEQAIPDDLPRIDRKRSPRWAAAAIILLLMATGFFIWNTRKDDDTKQPIANKETTPANDRMPGSEKAVLLLGDNSVIQLDDASNGTIAVQGNMRVNKNKDGQIIYTAGENPTNTVFYNTVKTPRGGQYQLVLPDGTKVWLNATTSLRFPTAFNGPERVVDLQGEAYFEVAKNPAQPFRVKTGPMDVNVLGTHFNVMAYSDEGLIRTTLLEGAVKINAGASLKFLQPGQQASFDSLNHKIQVKVVDTEEAVAWKNNLFWFNNADIRSVMRQIARWYDVDVEYQGAVTKLFKGTIPRNMNASKVFAILEETGGVHFRIEGQRVVVMP